MASNRTVENALITHEYLLILIIGIISRRFDDIRAQPIEWLVLRNMISKYKLSCIKMCCILQIPRQILFMHKKASARLVSVGKLKEPKILFLIINFHKMSTFREFFNLSRKQLFPQYILFGNKCAFSSYVSSL